MTSAGGLGGAIFSLATDNSAFTSGLDEAKSAASSAVSSIAADLGAIAEPATFAVNSIIAIGDVLRDIAVTAYGLRAITTGFENIGESVLGSSMQIESYTTRLADSEKANGAFGDSAQIAQAKVADLSNEIKGTNFALPDVEQGVIGLENIGGAALASTKNVQLIMDASAATGKSFSDMSRQLQLLYTQLQAGDSVGRAAIQFERWGVLTAQQIDQLKALEKSGADFNTVWQDAVDMLSRYQGAAKAQGDTMQGIFTQVKQQWQQDVRDMAQPLMTELEPAFQKFTIFLSGPEIKQALGIIGVGLDEIVQKTLTFVEQEGPKFITFVEQIASDAQSVNWSGILSLVDPLTVLATSILPQFLPAMTAAAQVLSNIASDIAPPLTAALTEINKVLKDHPALVDAIVGAWLAFKVKDIIIDVVDLGKALGQTGLSMLGFGQTSRGVAAEVITAQAEQQAALDKAIISAEVAYRAEAAAAASGVATVAQADAAKLAAARAYQADLELTLATIETEVVEETSTTNSFLGMIGTGPALIGILALPLIFSDNMNQILQIVEDVGKAIGEALSYLDPFAQHSPALVDQVTSGMNVISSAYDQTATRATSGANTIAAGMRTVSGEFIAAIVPVQQVTQAVKSFSDTAQLPNVDQLIEHFRDMAQPVQSLPPLFSDASDAVKQLGQDTQNLQDMFGRLDFTDLKSKFQIVDPSAIDSLSAAHDQIDQVTSSVAQAKSAFDDAQAGLQPLKDTIDQLNDQALSMRDHIDQLTDATQPFKDALDDAKSKLDDLRDPLEAAKEALTDAKDATNAYKSAIEELGRSQKQTFEDAKEPLQRHSDALKDQLADIEDRMAGVPKTIKEAYSTMTEHGVGAHARLSERIKTQTVQNPYYAQLEAEKQRIEAQQRGVESQTRHLNTQERAIDEKTKEQLNPARNPYLSELEQAQKQAKSQVDQLEEGYKKQESAVRAADQAYKDHTKSVQEATKQYNDFQVTIRAAQRAYDEQNQSVQALNKHYQDEKSELESLTKQYDAYATLVNTAYSKIESAANVYSQKRDEASKAQADANAELERGNELMQAAGADPVKQAEAQMVLVHARELQVQADQKATDAQTALNNSYLQAFPDAAEHFIKPANDMLAQSEEDYRLAQASYQSAQLAAEEKRKLDEANKAAAAAAAKALEEQKKALKAQNDATVIQGDIDANLIKLNALGAEIATMPANKPTEIAARNEKQAEYNQLIAENAEKHAELKVKQDEAAGASSAADDAALARQKALLAQAQARTAAARDAQASAKTEVAAAAPDTRKPDAIPDYIGQAPEYAQNLSSSYYDALNKNPIDPKAFKGMQESIKIGMLAMVAAPFLTPIVTSIAATVASALGAAFSSVATSVVATPIGAAAANWLGTAFAALPTGPALLGGLAVGAAGVALLTVQTVDAAHNMQHGHMATGVSQIVGGAVGAGIGTIIGGPIGGIIGANIGMFVGGVVGKFMEEHHQQFGKAIGDIGSWLGGKWSDVWSGIKSIFNDTISFIKEHAGLLVAIFTGGPLGVAIYEFATHWHDIWNGAKIVFNDVVSFIKEHAGLLVAVFTGGPLGVAIYEFATHWHDVWQGVENVVKTVWDYLTRFFGWVGDQLGRFGGALEKVAGWFGGGGGSAGQSVSRTQPGPQQNQVPGYQQGAWQIPQTQVAMLHAGEMVVPPEVADMLRQSLATPAARPFPTGSSSLPPAAQGSASESQQAFDAVRQMAQAQADAARQFQTVIQGVPAQSTGLDQMRQQLQAMQDAILGNTGTPSVDASHNGPLVHIENYQANNEADLQRLSQILDQMQFAREQDHRRALGRH